MRIGCGDIADGSVAGLLPGLEILSLVAPLRAGHHGEFQLLGLFSRGHDLADAHRIGAEGLLGEDLFPGLHCRNEMLGPVAGRSCQQDYIDVGGQYRLVGVEADEAVIRIDLDLIGDVRVFRGPHFVERLSRWHQREFCRRGRTAPGDWMSVSRRRTCRNARAPASHTPKSVRPNQKTRLWTPMFGPPPSAEPRDTQANLSVAATRARLFGGSKALWPLSGVMTRSASGHSRWSAHALSMGQTMS